ncbi:MAG TPA: N-acetyltransferase, partial [Anaerolineaceae bacterium]|nr:N-acetyltransferase [Anaerolineaceae bacterium]
MEIRLERPGDAAGIYAVEQAAFDRVGEAELVDKVRAAHPQAFSLVAVDDGQIVGHVLFSPMQVDPGKPGLKAAGLGPLAVLPERQCQQIGSALSVAGLDECRRRGYDLAFVLGHSDYYP